MKKNYTLIIVIALSFGIYFLKAQVPTPLTSADFPEPLDSISIRENTIPPTETFTDSISANDSLTIDRCLQKALIALGDNDMSDIATSGPSQSWQVVTFYYNSLPNPKIWNKVYNLPNSFVPGATSFPTANLYYVGDASGTITYNFYNKDISGFYELGTRVQGTTPYNVTNVPQKPTVLFPVDYNSPNNVTNLNVTSSGGGATTNTILNVTVDAYGTLTLVTGSISNPVYTPYDNCLRTVTTSIDTMDVGSGMLFYLKTKIYSWYAPGIFEPIVIFSVAQVRNNIDPTYWPMDPMLPWHDEIAMSYSTLFATGINEDIAQDAFNLYPNPSSGIIHVNVLSYTEQMFFEIYDIVGKMVYSQTLGNTDNIIDISSLPKGAYTIKIYSDSSIKTEKLILK